MSEKPNQSWEPAGGAGRTSEAEEQRVRAALGGSQAGLQAIISAAMDAIISIDAQQRVVLFNPAAEKLFGVSAREALGESINKFIPERYRRAHTREVEAFGQTGTTSRRMGSLGTLTALRATGEEFPIEASISQAEVNGEKLFTVILRDITERRQQEEQLRLQAAALEAAANAIILTDRAGVIQWVNPAFERLTGYSAAEVVGQNPRVLKSEQQREPGFFRQMWETILAGRVWHGELVNQRKDGSVYHEEMTITPVRDRRGESTHFIAIKQDITERREAQRALRRARDKLQQANAELERRVNERTARLQEAVAELEQMSYSMIHDLRAPLRAIQSFGEMLVEDPENRLSPEGQELVARMRTAANRMDHLVCDVLNYSRVVQSELPLEPVDVGALARGIVETYPDFQSPRCELRVAADLPWVQGNAAALTQCLAHLLSNAVKFARPGQVAQVALKAEPGHNGRVRLVVEDNGIGIAPEYQGKVFGMFQRLSTEVEGTGMGLTLVRKAAERMGGRVGLESEPGKGSRFWLELKAADRPKA